MGFFNRTDLKLNFGFILTVFFVLATVSCSGPIELLKAPEVAEKKVHPKDRLYAYDKKIGRVLEECSFD